MSDRFFEDAARRVIEFIEASLERENPGTWTREDVRKVCDDVRKLQDLIRESGDEHLTRMLEPNLFAAIGATLAMMVYRD